VSKVTIKNPTRAVMRAMAKAIERNPQNESAGRAGATTPVGRRVVATEPKGFDDAWNVRLDEEMARQGFDTDVQGNLAHFLLLLKEGEMIPERTWLWALRTLEGAINNPQGFAARIPKMLGGEEDPRAPRRAKRRRTSCTSPSRKATR